MKKRLAFFSVILIVVFALSTLIVTPAMADSYGMSLSMAASAAEVCEGETVDLTVTLDNFGTYYDIGNITVTVQPLGLTLLPDPSSGDLNDDDILQTTETWEWTVTSAPLYAPATFTAQATGYVIPCGLKLCCLAEVSVNVVPCETGEGFTPGYWKNHLEDWTGYDPAQYFDDVFGVGPEITLDEAVNARGGGEKALLRHATAALLNAAHPNVDYEYTVAEVIAMVQDAYNTGDFNGVKNDLAYYNELEGDITS